MVISEVPHVGYQSCERLSVRYHMKVISGRLSVSCHVNGHMNGYQSGDM